MKEQILFKLPPGHPWGALLNCYDCVDSTNTLAKALAAQGAPHGTAIIAHRQTGGRGRMGRQFHSPGNAGVYLSVILRPGCRAQQLMHLTCAVAVAVSKAIEDHTGLRPGIKWINDLVWEKRKIAGILTELSMEPGSDNVSYAVVGIGVNCRQKPEDFPPEIAEIAASLSMAAGQDVSPTDIAAAILNRLYQMDGSFLTEKAVWMEQYRNRCINLGQTVSIHRGDTVTYARAVDIDDDGALIVSYPDGTSAPVNSGEVSIRGMYGYL